MSILRTVGIVTLFGCAVALAAQVRPPTAPTSKPGARPVGPLIIDRVQPREMPVTIVNGELVEGARRDTVLRALRGKRVDSIVVLPAGPAAQARYGSRAAGGAVLIGTR